MKKTAILFTSRNNYNLLDVWLSRVDIEGFSVLNIDEDSTPENKEIGKSVCEKHGVVYMDREIRSISPCNLKNSCSIVRILNGNLTPNI